MSMLSILSNIFEQDGRLKKKEPAFYPPTPPKDRDGVLYYGGGFTGVLRWVYYNDPGLWWDFIKIDAGYDKKYEAVKLVCKKYNLVVPYPEENIYSSCDRILDDLCKRSEGEDSCNKS